MTSRDIIAVMILWDVVVSVVMFCFGYYLWTRADTLAQEEVAVLGGSHTYVRVRRWGHRFGGLFFGAAATANLVALIV